jgi:hypothetical protein
MQKQPLGEAADRLKIQASAEGTQSRLDADSFMCIKDGL